MFLFLSPRFARSFIANRDKSWKQAGREQNRSGQEQEAKGQLNDYTSGVTDRVTGAAGNTFASLTGDRDAQAEYQRQHDVGKSQQRGAEHDIQKQADAAQKNVQNNQN